MSTLLSVLVNVTSYVAIGAVVCQVFTELMTSNSSKQARKQIRQFMAIVYACTWLFCMIIATAEYHQEAKEAAAAAAAKAARSSICHSMSDDVNAYASFDAFFARRNSCVVEFGRIKLVKSGAAATWND